VPLLLPLRLLYEDEYHCCWLWYQRRQYQLEVKKKKKKEEACSALAQLAKPPGSAPPNSCANQPRPNRKLRRVRGR
jgi:hypothetical protein